MAQDIGEEEDGVQGIIEEEGGAQGVLEEEGGASHCCDGGLRFLVPSCVRHWAE